MSVRDGLEALQWLFLVVLSLTVVGLAWLVRLLDQRVSESFIEPHRMQVGDLIRPPSEVEVLTEGKSQFLILMASASCRSCPKAYAGVQNLALELSLVAITLWQEVVPAYADGDLQSLPHQLAVFDELKVGVTPFGLMISHGRVVVRGALSSSDAIADFADRVRATGLLDRAALTSD